MLSDAGLRVFFCSIFFHLSLIAYENLLTALPEVFNFQSSSGYM